MPRRLAASLPEALDLVERQVVAGDVQQAVQQRRTVAGGEHEAFAVGPQRLGGVVLQESLPQHVGHRRRAERQAGMAAVGLLYRVGGKEAQRVDAALVEGSELMGGGPGSAPCWRGGASASIIDRAVPGPLWRGESG